MLIAMARPIPVAAPVIATTLPVRSLTDIVGLGKLGELGDLVFRRAKDEGYMGDLYVYPPWQLILTLKKGSLLRGKEATGYTIYISATIFIT